MATDGSSATPTRDLYISAVMPFLIDTEIGTGRPNLRQYASGCRVNIYRLIHDKRNIIKRIRIYLRNKIQITFSCYKNTWYIIYDISILNNKEIIKIPKD